jgi:putative SOS response-associated peptidase YedK
MCRRFALINKPNVVEEYFATADFEDFPARYNIAPTQPILLVTAGFGREPGSNLANRRSMLVRWGLIPGWAKNPKDMSLLINARVESANENAAFRAAMRHRRSLIPASGFYEWQRDGASKGQPYWVRPRHGGVIAFAGLMETWLEPGGSEIDTAAILTTSANGVISRIHDRMPVVIEPSHFDRWLDCLNSEPRDVADLLKPMDPDLFEAIPISDKVNRVTNTGPDLQHAVAAADVRSEPQLKDSAQLSLF